MEKENFNTETKFGYKIKKSNVDIKDLGNELNNNAIPKHQFLPSDFISLIVGKPGSGKTHLIQNLILQEGLYYKFFDGVYIFSPNLFNKEMCYEGVNYFSELSIPKIFECIELHNKSQKDLEKRKEKKTSAIQILFIIDDFISVLKTNENSPSLINLFFNRRHLIHNGTVSFLITTQKYNMFPLKFRSCISSIYFFLLTQKELKTICDETGIMDFKQIRDIFQKFSAETPHLFFLYKYESNSLYLNFDEIYLK